MQDQTCMFFLIFQYSSLEKMQSLYLDCTNRVNSFQTGKLMVSSMNMLNHGDTFYSYENKAIILQKIKCGTYSGLHWLPDATQLQMTLHSLNFNSDNLNHNLHIAAHGFAGQWRQLMVHTIIILLFQQRPRDSSWCTRS